MATTMAGCSSKEKSSAGGTPDPDAATTLGGVKLTWAVAEYTFDSLPIEGAELCVLDHGEIPCVTTDADGKFVLAGLPKDTELVLTVDDGVHMKALKTIVTNNTDMDGTGFGFIQMLAANQDSTAWGQTLDMTKGFLGFFATGSLPEGGFGPIPGCKMSLTPDTGSKAVYMGSSGFDPLLTETASFGGQFANLPDGTYKLTVSAPAEYDCEGIAGIPFAGWGIPAPTGEHATTVHVRGGYFATGAGVFCTPSSTPGPTDAGDGG